MRITELHLRKRLRKIILEFGTQAGIARDIAAASEGIFKPGSSSRGAPQVRLSVASTEKAEDAKNLSRKKKKEILRNAGYEVTAIIPRPSEFSRSFDAFQIVPINDRDAKPRAVVFGGADKISRELAAIEAMDDQISTLGEGDILISPDPNSEFAELRRPRLVMPPKKVSGTPKADVEFPGASAQDTIYMSLKAGSKPKDHQQWSGVTKFNNSPKVRAFVKQVVGISEAGEGLIQLPKRTRKTKGNVRVTSSMSFHQKLGDSPIEQELKIWSLYGTDSFPIVPSGFSEEKVHLIIQADRPDVALLSPSETKKLHREFPESAGKPIYTILGAHKVSYPQIPTSGYDPYLHVRYASDGIKIGQFLDDKFVEETGIDPGVSYKGVRFLVYPKDKLPAASQEISKYQAGVFGTVEEALLRRYIRRLLS